MALEVAVQAPVLPDRLNIDATIQRFEFTIELFWKLLKVIVESKGVIVVFPKDVLRAAYQGNLIDDEELWLAMLKDRNLSSHVYNQDLADEIYAHIKQYCPLLRCTYEKLYAEYQD